MTRAKNEPEVARYADMFSAMGTEPRLRIMRLLLSAHPQGMTSFERSNPPVAALQAAAREASGSLTAEGQERASYVRTLRSDR